MIVTTAQATEGVDRAAFESATGWEFKPEGACRGEVCIPLADKPGPHSDSVDVGALASALNMGVAVDQERGLLAVGPASTSGRALVTAAAPELVLPDLDGNEFALSSLRGSKVVLVAWSPY